MTKRIIAVLLCLLTIVGCMAGCATYDENEDKGQCLTMYLTQDLYDLDPMYAYNNESAINVVSLLFDTLFKLDENGKVVNSLASGYSVKEDANANEYKMYINIKDTCWSDGTQISADDVVYAWKRVLDPESSSAAAPLLYDIKNARDVKAGDRSIDDLGIYAEGTQLLSIEFEGKIDYSQFLLNLTSVALAPLRENITGKGDEWAKKAVTMVCSGPFKLGRTTISETKSGVMYDHTGFLEEVRTKDANGKETVKGVICTETRSFPEYTQTSFTLERNAYYYRDREKDSIKKTVTPYKIIVDCSMTDEEIKSAYESGRLFYIGDIPVSMRNDFASEAEVRDSMSTNLISLNQNAQITNKKTGKTETLFANKEVRQALSAAIDREAIVKSVVFAKVATGLVPEGVFETSSAKKTFRDGCSETYKYLTYNVDEAKSLLSTAGINPSDYAFTITCAAYDEVHTMIAEAVCEAWKSLGFDVTLKKRGAIRNQDYYKYTDSTPTDICDDLYQLDLKKGDYETIIYDMTATSVDSFSVLAPFAKGFSGQASVFEKASLEEDVGDTETEKFPGTAHSSGYNSDEYNQLISDIFAQKTIKNRKDNLYAAEKLLMEDMPVIPILFNQYATVSSKEIKNVKSEYAYLNSFSKLKVSDSVYKSYAYDIRDYLEANYEELTNRNISSISSYKGKEYSRFSTETHVYSFAYDYIRALENPTTKSSSK